MCTRRGFFRDSRGLTYHLAVPSEVDRSGEEIAGRYVIEGEIGRGGMGAVYAARDTRLGRRVALKMVASASQSPTQMRLRLETEARAVASIEHPGIVTLYDVVEHVGEMVLVMELVAGVTLREMLKERAFSPEEVANIVYEVSDALDAAHAKDLVHRDVKPDNMMLRPDGRIALLDFGVAKITSDGVDPLGLTDTGVGVIIGTPAYLAPEQARGGPIGPLADQFALGVTAYELLTRSLPWPTTTPMLTVAAIVSGDPKPLEGYDAAVGAVIARALAKNPADRFPNVRDFASALGAALGVTHPSRPRSLLPTTSNRTPVLSPSSAPKVPSTMEIGKTLLATETVRAPSPLRSSRRPFALAAVVVAIAAIWFGLHRHKKAVAPALPRDSTTALALADVPASVTTSTQARAKFREAMRQLSFGRGSAPSTLLDAAIEADPEFASAYLQRAFVSFRLAGSLDGASRRAYTAALEHKARLGARDVELLDAIGPSFVDPPDWQESGKRLEAMLARRPGDAQAWEALGDLKFKASDLEASEAAFEREQAVDPNAYGSYFMRGHIRSSRGDLDGARKIFSECVDRIPATIDCRAAITSIHRLLGDCVAADRVAREIALLAPDQSLSYKLRAECAAALDAPDDAVTELLGQKRSHLPEARRAAEKSNDDYLLAMRHGDFTAAVAALDARERAADDPKLEDLGEWTMQRVHVLWEMGERTKSGDVALAFLNRMTAHVVPEQPGQDPTGSLLAFAYASKRMTDVEYVKRRDAWIAGWRARLGERNWRNDGIYVWLDAYASTTDPSAEQAREAFDALPTFGVYDARHVDASVRFLDPEVGALFLAVGKLDEANLLLGEAMRWCKLVPYVHAFYLYGETRARMGDTAGACAAFASVEQRWGHAKPRSTTLEAARAAMKKYQCAH